MIWDRISNSLQEKGFVPSTKDKRIAEFLIKVTDDKKMYICSIIKNIGGADISADTIIDSAEQLERKFLLGGYCDVSVMHIIITDRDTDVARLEELGVQFWLVDVRSHRFMIFENQTSNYFGIKEVIEDALAHEQSIPQVRQLRDYLYFNRVPIITILLITANLIVFLLCEIWGDSENSLFMIKMGALNSDLIYDSKEYYRLITCMFLHFGFMHLGNNIFMLALVGSRVEEWFGSIKFLLLYFISGIGASVASVIYHAMNHQDVISAGASGAVYGVFGAMIVGFVKNDNREIDLRHIGLVVFLLIFGSMEAGVDVAAHVGGFVIGSLTAFAFDREKAVGK